MLDIVYVWKLMMLLIAFFFALFISEVAGEEEFWDISHVKGVMKGQSLRFSRITHPTNQLHSCYRVICTGSHCSHNDQPLVRDFCYPAIIITGLPKCGTSAMYDLLTKLPGVFKLHEKENCPYTRRRSHMGYFLSLPSFHDIKENTIIIDGCIDVINNMKMRAFLKNPHTYYVVMIRDYADMIWSSYNFWCKLTFDINGCLYDRWTVKGKHVRSPELFHDLIVADAERNTSVIQPFYYPMHKPCINAGGYYNEYIDFHIKPYVPSMNYTIVIASEEMELAPRTVLEKVVKEAGLQSVLSIATNLTNSSSAYLDLGDFTKIRINSQDNKGVHGVVSLTQYHPGVYNISDYRPMLEKTGMLLNTCWHSDCLKIAERIGYHYKACMDSSSSFSSSSYEPTMAPSSSSAAGSSSNKRIQQQQVTATSSMDSLASSSGMRVNNHNRGTNKQSTTTTGAAASSASSRTRNNNSLQQLKKFKQINSNSNSNNNNNHQSNSNDKEQPEIDPKHPIVQQIQADKQQIVMTAEKYVKDIIQAHARDRLQLDINNV